MIFPMDPPRMAAFWMKNTVIPLDIIFIGPNHRVLNVAANAVPYDLTRCRPPGRRRRCSNSMAAARRRSGSSRGASPGKRLGARADRQHGCLLLRR
jgi:uncharacterized membrane protein (UPF0127 family)